MDQSRFYIFTPARIQKCFTQLRNILAFLTINHQQAESCIYQRIFLQVILVPIIVPWQYIFLHVTLNCRTILQLCCIFTLILSFGRGDCVFLSYLLTFGCVSCSMLHNETRGRVFRSMFYNGTPSRVFCSIFQHYLSKRQQRTS